MISANGYIKANSNYITSIVFNDASSGSEGSIIVNTANFTSNFHSLITERYAMLSVDGYIKANSYHTISIVYNGASVGSGGSIIINTAISQVIFIA